MAKLGLCLSYFAVAVAARPNLSQLVDGRVCQGLQFHEVGGNDCHGGSTAAGKQALEQRLSSYISVHKHEAKRMLAGNGMDF
ncbi:rCG62928 [Rattus norvegicus]|uniref:RCG62928 n=1 Tax=Rattus norvegicus TaxID=10116 RepID=A6I2W3_RAT|nr:rCG62928 [Rattus norvegicus]